jgi:hypothetical protein
MTTQCTITKSTICLMIIVIISVVKSCSWQSRIVHRWWIFDSTQMWLKTAWCFFNTTNGTTKQATGWFNTGAQICVATGSVYSVYIIKNLKYFGNITSTRSYNIRLRNWSYMIDFSIKRWNFFNYRL